MGEGIEAQKEGRRDPYFGSCSSAKDHITAREKVGISHRGQLEGHGRNGASRGRTRRHGGERGGRRCLRLRVAFELGPARSDQLGDRQCEQAGARGRCRLGKRNGTLDRLAGRRIENSQIRQVRIASRCDLSRRFVGRRFHKRGAQLNRRNPLRLLGENVVAADNSNGHPRLFFAGLGVSSRRDDREPDTECRGRPRRQSSPPNLDTAFARRPFG